MATFYYNESSNKSYLEQWGDHLQNEAFVTDLKKIARQQSNSFNETIKHASQNEVAAIQQSTKSICGSIESGFERVNDQLGDINWRLNDLNEGLGNLQALLDWKTDVIIEELKISNVFLGNITRLLQIPDSQKQRAYHVEQGLVYLKNAIQEGPKSLFYSDAHEELLKAKSIEEKDFFSLHKLGLIHLNSIKYLDPAKAESYFTASARYAKAFASALPANSPNVLSLRVQSDGNQTFTKTSLLEEATTALIYASRCCYISQNLNQGIIYAEEALRIEPNNPEAGLQLAKMHSAAGHLSEAADAIERVLKSNYYYAVKVLNDYDLISKLPIQTKLNEITKNTLLIADIEYNKCKDALVPGSQATKKLEAVTAQIIRRDYLSAKMALALLSEKQNWELTTYSIDKKIKYETPTKRPLLTKTETIHETLFNFVLEEAKQIKLRREMLDFIDEDYNAQDIAKRKNSNRTLIRTALFIGVPLLCGGVYGLVEGIGFGAGIIELLKLIGALIIVILIVYALINEIFKSK